jgi:myosin heavy subunit
VKGGDSIFPNEPEGSWAVGIKLEDDELKALAKSGELSGISMAGKAQKTEVEKGEGGKENKAYKNFFETLAEATTGMWVDFGTYIEKGEGTDMDGKVKDFGAIMKEKLTAATKEAGKQLDQIAKDRDAQGVQLETLKKSVDAANKNIVVLQKTNEELTTANEKLAEDVKTQAEANDTLAEINKTLTDENKTLSDTVEKHASQLEALKKDTAAVTEAVKKTKQTTTVKKVTKPKATKGVM